MVKKYDIESVLDDIDAILKADLNSKITEINTEKGDSVSMKSLDNAAFYRQSSDGFENYDPFVIYGIVDAPVESVGSGNIFSSIFAIRLVLTDDGQYKNQGEFMNLLLRYLRALVEVVEKNALKKFKQYPKISTVIPIPFFGDDENQFQNTWIVGVNMEIIIG